jgi:hypothetical protein
MKKATNQIKKQITDQIKSELSETILETRLQWGDGSVPSYTSRVRHAFFVGLTGNSGLTTWITMRVIDKDTMGMAFCNTTDSAILEHRLAHEEVVPMTEVVNRVVDFLKKEAVDILLSEEEIRHPKPKPPEKPFVSEFQEVPTETLSKILWEGYLE